MMRCYMADYGYYESGQPMDACSGRLIKAHLIPQQLLKRHGHDPNDPRSWVWCCGGIVGLAGHHGRVDTSRTLRLRRAAIPRAVEELARELDLEWWLDREYGPPADTRGRSSVPASR